MATGWTPNQCGNASEVTRLFSFHHGDGRNFLSVHLKGLMKIKHQCKKERRERKENEKLIGEMLPPAEAAVVTAPRG